MDSNCRSGLCWPVMQQVVYYPQMYTGCSNASDIIHRLPTGCHVTHYVPIPCPPRVVESLNEISKSQTSWSRVYNYRISHLQVPPFNTLLEKSRRLSQNRECKILDIRWSQRVFPGWYSLHGRSGLFRGLFHSCKSITFLELLWPYRDLFTTVIRRWL